MNIGILALQGAFIEHTKMIEALGVRAHEIRQRRDMDRSYDGLILPGGESTVMGKLLRELDLLTAVKSMIEGGLPVLGTCAGLILLAKRISNGGAGCIATMDITAVRNAYGRQLGSFHTVADMQGIGTVPMTFIRAPYIESAEPNVNVLAEVDGHIVAARQERQLVTSFHPELTGDTSVHRYFLDMCASR